MKDLVLNKNYKKGMKAKKIRLIQEWLCLHGHNLVIDGDFGPATDRAVKDFQTKKHVRANGIVDKKTFQHMIMPMTNALEPLTGDGKPLGKMVVSYAQKHLKWHPREVGGQNKGPWVRLYMKGYEGPAWPWCAGFACFILGQACKCTNSTHPVKSSFSCDYLAVDARNRGVFLKESQVADKTQITPGSLFLVRKTATDWIHTGIVEKAEDDFMYTIEGNTNDEGSREGYEVCKRIRGYKNMDFILM